MSVPIIDICIASGGDASMSWVVPTMMMLVDEERQGNFKIGKVRGLTSMLRDYNRQMTMGEFTTEFTQDHRDTMTDANRLEAIRGGLAGNADWFFWLDDDVDIPNGTISQFLRMRRDAVSGLYYQPGNKITEKPSVPVAYYRDEDGYYRPIQDWPHACLIQVDSVGLGCCLTHRSLYERIMEDHLLFERPDSTIYPVHKSKVFKPTGASHKDKPDIFVQDGWFHMRAKQVGVDVMNFNRAWPFFALEYGRTEDHYFWELAESVGVKPWLDTSINCSHAKTRFVTREDYKEDRRKQRESAAAG